MDPGSFIESPIEEKRKEVDFHSFQSRFVLTLQTVSHRGGRGMDKEDREQGMTNPVKGRVGTRGHEVSEYRLYGPRSRSVMTTSG